MTAQRPVAPAFDCLALVPCGPLRPRAAVSAARNGGVGILDLEFAAPAVEGGFGSLDQVQWFADRLRRGDRAGLRIPAQKLTEYSPHLKVLGVTGTWLILTGEAVDRHTEWSEIAGNYRILIEVRSADFCERMMQAGIRP
ncbi:MAG: hypothetical protein JO022_19895, partial [Acidobacteriaceae bacterium]|nr:hypothetical protein [Acidobacteriaceae bacterium]